MGVLAKDDYGREYSEKEKNDFAQLILMSDLGTVQVGELMAARSWPGVLGSTLLELQRATRRENVDETRSAAASREAERLVDEPRRPRA